MRNPDRIVPLLTQLGEIWAQYFPDWRFMQVVCNFQAWLKSDGFYIEDDKLIEKFCEFVITNHAPRYVNTPGVGPS